MPRFKQIAEIQRLMDNKEQIRNIGIIAHIDHGKTTLADSLLAGAGLLSPQMAGAARVLDYLEEEQRRKITLKTANISFFFKLKSDSYLVNLVDTPGHVDFTGKVIRALRAVDGVVVAVDAVEEVMVQTEILLRQALEQRVRPVLFINKVDRLITELQLTPEQVDRKLRRVISGFNDLIELYGEEPFKDEWKIDAAKGTVAFGSALHGWGFNLGTAKKKRIKFADVVAAYKSASHNQLRKTLPVYDAVFEMAVKNLPNPRQAQAYRVERIWSGPRNSHAGKAIADCSNEQPTVFCVTNVHAPSPERSVVTGRVFSGTIRKGDKLHCVSALREILVENVYVSMGSFKEKVGWVSAGNIVVLEVSGMLQTGETLVDEAHKTGMVPFESISYLSEPVLTVIVEPKNPKDIFDLLKALHKIITEDPNLTFSVDKETGEYHLSAMGELHLEVALNLLKSVSGGISIDVSSPRVVYRETATKKGAVATASSSKKLNTFTLQVEPQDEQSNPFCIDESSTVISVDEQRNVLVDCKGSTESLNQDVLSAIIGGFEFACKAGPLCGEPMRHVKVNLLSLQLSNEGEQWSPTEIMHGIGKAVFGSFLTAKPVLLEPVYRIVVTLPTELAGVCSRIIETRRGKVTSFEQKGLQTIITGHIPVAETFGFSEQMRSATSGRAIWQNILDCWQRVPSTLSTKTIAEIRNRKGLAAEVPSASRFMEER